MNILELPYKEDTNKERFLVISSKKYYQVSFNKNLINNEEYKREFDYEDLFQNKVINNLYKQNNLIKLGEDYIILISKKNQIMKMNYYFIILIKKK